MQSYARNPPRGLGAPALSQLGKMNSYNNARAVGLESGHLAGSPMRVENGTPATAERNAMDARVRPTAAFVIGDGEFIGKDCAVAQMQDIVEQAMKKQGYSWPMRKLARAQIPQLARWKKQG